MGAFGLRREAKRHAALVSEPFEVKTVPICGAQAVSSLRFATAVRIAPVTGLTDL
jgi:hypothetical protein